MQLINEDFELTTTAKFLCLIFVYVE